MTLSAVEAGIYNEDKDKCWPVSYVFYAGLWNYSSRTIGIYIFDLILNRPALLYNACEKTTQWNGGKPLTKFIGRALEVQYLLEILLMIYPACELLKRKC